jgi:hypothetical protein
MKPPNNLPPDTYWPSEKAQQTNKSLAAYAKALAVELASGKTFPRPDPEVEKRWAEGNKNHPDYDLKHATAVMDAKVLVKQSQPAALEREDKARQLGKLRNIHACGKYGGK